MFGPYVGIWACQRICEISTWRGKSWSDLQMMCTANGGKKKSGTNYQRVHYLPQYISNWRRRCMKLMKQQINYGKFQETKCPFPWRCGTRARKRTSGKYDVSELTVDFLIPKMRKHVVGANISGFDQSEITHQWEAMEQYPLSTPGMKIKLQISTLIHLNGSAAWSIKCRNHFCYAIMVLGLVEVPGIRMDVINMQSYHVCIHVIKLHNTYPIKSNILRDSMSYTACAHSDLLAWLPQQPVPSRSPSNPRGWWNGAEVKRHPSRFGCLGCCALLPSPSADDRCSAADHTTIVDMGRSWTTRRPKKKEKLDMERSTPCSHGDGFLPSISYIYKGSLKIGAGSHQSQGWVYPIYL